MNDYRYEPIEEVTPKAYYKIYFDKPVRGLSKEVAVVEVVWPHMHEEKVSGEDIIFGDTD